MLKHKFNFIIFTALIFFLPSCCDEYYEIGLLHIRYENLIPADNVLIISQSTSIANAPLDTSYLGGISLPNDYTVEFLLPKSEFIYYVYLYNNGRVDTIADYHITRGRCEQIKSQSFKLNGEFKEGNEVLISM